MTNETTTYKGFTPPTLDEMKRFSELEVYDIYTPLGGSIIHFKTTDKNLFNLYINGEMTEEDTKLVMSQFNDWKNMILEGGR